MRQTAEVAIIGGGILGLSTAYQLARRGVRGVLVLERNTLGSGATGKALGGIRRTYSTEVGIRFSLVSIEIFTRFKEEFGADPEFHQTGYLYLASTEAELEVYRRNLALQRAMGVPATVLTPSEMKAHWPWLRVDDLVGASYCPLDGYAGPNEVVQGFARRARELGVLVSEGVEVTGVGVADGRITGIRTGGGEVSTRRVVIAAGPWSAQVGAMAGVDIPVRPIRREIFISDPIPGRPPELPMVFEPVKSWYFRPEGEGVMMAGRIDAGPSYDQHVDWGRFPKSAEKAVHRAPFLERATFPRAYAGTLEMSPDYNGIIGAIPEVEGLYVVAGFSGHGFQHAPAAGLVMAELITEGRASTIDITPLSIERFRRGELIREPVLSFRGLDQDQRAEPTASLDSLE